MREDGQATQPMQWTGRGEGGEASFDIRPEPKCPMGKLCQARCGLVPLHVRRVVGLQDFTVNGYYCTDMDD